MRIGPERTTSSKSASERRRVVRVAQVRGVRGLDGTLRLEPLTDRPERWFSPGSTLAVDEMDRTLTLIEATPAAPGVFVRFGEVADRASAQRLVGAYLSVEVSDTPEAAPGERRVYWDDVIGVDVRDRMGRLVGTVADCYRAGGAEVYVVKTPDGGEIDLPAVAGVIVDFDPRNGIITVDLDGSELAVRPPKRPTRSRSRVRDGANRVSSERP